MARAVKPYVFVGSSVEGLPLAKAIQLNLDYECECQLWPQGVFNPSTFPLSTLVSKLSEYDYAILVLTPDDLTTSRDLQSPSPRDNVVLELGLFVGGLGIDRVFIIVERGAKVKLPSDLAGLTPATYEKPNKGNWQSAIGAACSAIGEQIKVCGLRSRDQYLVEIAIFSYFELSGTGFGFTVRNMDRKQLPPYRAMLRRKSNTLKIFNSPKDGTPLLADQKREHRAPPMFDADGKLSYGYSFLESYFEDANFEEWVIELELVDSDKVVLFQDTKNGSRLAHSLHKAFKTGSVSTDDEEGKEE